MLQHIPIKQIQNTDLAGLGKFSCATEEDLETLKKEKGEEMKRKDNRREAQEEMSMKTKEDV